MIDNVSASSYDLHSDYDYDYPDRKGEPTKKRKKEVNFDLDDIMGEFDIDDSGNIIINRDMTDNFNRLVNRHGYLIDINGNIIN